MTHTGIWLKYVIASRGDHRDRDTKTQQLIELEYENHKLLDLEDVLQHGKRCSLLFIATHTDTRTDRSLQGGLPRGKVSRRDVVGKGVWRKING